MLALLYLIICVLFGMTFVMFCVRDIRRLFLACAPTRSAIRNIPSSLFLIPAGTITGLTTVSFVNYYITLGLSYAPINDTLARNLGIAISLVLAVLLSLSFLTIYARHKIDLRDSGAPSASASTGEYAYSVVNSIFYGICVIILTALCGFLMFYTYRIDGTTLKAGFSIFSDLSPHTAMVSSFAEGFNFPTQYMHFSGDGIRYHFLFYFLCGTLKYLGLPIDSALNLPSIIVMVCAFVLLGLLAALLSGRRVAFAVAPVLVLFRSSLNVFVHIHDLRSYGYSFEEAVKYIFADSEWYAVTPYDNWGIWAINVYPNQRHLMLGVAMILIAIILLIPYMRRMCISIESSGFNNILFARNAWLTRPGDPLNPAGTITLLCTLVAVMPYFHGSCLIALLLVAAAMAVFSESRFIHLSFACVAVLSSVIQTTALSGGASRVVSLKFNPGFILEGATAYSLARYLLIVTGLTLILSFVTALVLLIVCLVRRKPVYRSLLFLCFLVPLVFAFMFTLTLETLANHKFIQISIILLDAYVAVFIANLIVIPFKRRKKDVESSTETESPAETELNEKPSGSGEVSSDNDSGNDNTDNSDAEPEKDNAASVAFGDEDSAGVNMRPGNVSLAAAVPAESSAVSASVSFGDEDEERAELAVDENNVTVIGETSVPAETSADNSNDVVSSTDKASSDSTLLSGETNFSTSGSKSDNAGRTEEDASSDIGSTEHKAVESSSSSRKKGLSLPAWIALECVGVILAAVLLVPLTATGVSEWCTYVNLNKNYVTIDTESSVADWIVNNTDPSDVFLTPMWSLNRFCLTGRAMYYGWPYYAWSAGHDTDTRDTVYCWLLTGCNGNIDEFTRYCKERGIRYLIYDPEFDYTEYTNGIMLNSEFFAENLTVAAYLADEDTTIYRIY